MFNTTIAFNLEWARIEAGKSPIRPLLARHYSDTGLTGTRAAGRRSTPSSRAWIVPTLQGCSVGVVRDGQLVYQRGYGIGQP
jgi:CubicO group peptidase (beta-lactamase class C family)